MRGNKLRANWVSTAEQFTRPYIYRRLLYN
jgi:hypothetical protein